MGVISRTSGGAPARAASPTTLRQAARPDRLLWAAALLVLAYVWRIQDLFGALAKIQLPILATGLALGLFILDTRPVRRFARIRSPIVTIAGALLALAVIGVPFSLVRSESLVFVIKELFPVLLLMTVVGCAVRTVRDVEWLSFGILVGGMLYAAYALVNFQVEADGRLSDLVYYDANDFALLLVSCVPFAVYFLRPGVEPWRRAIALLALPLFTLMLVRTGSRGGFLGFVVVGAYLAIGFRAVPKSWRWGSVLAGALMLGALGGPQYWEKIRSLANPKEDYNWAGNSPEGRLEIWKRGLGYMMQRPLFGVGAKAFPTAEGRLSQEAAEFAARRKGWKWSVAHSSYIEIGAELGVPGLLLFLSLLYVGFREAWRVTRRRRSREWLMSRETALAQTFFGALLGFAVCGIFLSAEWFAWFYLVLGLILGLVKVVRLGEAKAGAPATLPRAARVSSRLTVARGAAGR